MMDIITEHRILLKRFDETQIELEEAENTLRNLRPYFRREDSKFSERYERNPIISSRRNISCKRFAVERPKLKDCRESPEESEDEDEHPTKKVSLQSAVISTSRNVKSRKDAISKQNVNRKVQLRNHRMVGMLQSTLRKFQDDAVKRQPQDLKRIMVEQKVEAAKEEERLRRQREETELHLKIRGKKLQLDCLKEMMRITELFETWIYNEKKLLNFIVTKAEPQICYLPASHTASSFKRYEKSRIETEKNIQKQEAAMKKELAQIRKSYQARNSTIVIENSALIKTNIPSDMPMDKCKFSATEEGKKYKEQCPNLHDDDDDDDDDILYLSYYAS